MTLKNSSGVDLDFTLQDSVAILGAHTLGKAHFENSGFEGLWTSAVNSNGAQSDFLNNRYYRHVAGDWHQVFSEGPEGRYKNLTPIHLHPHIFFKFCSINSYSGHSLFRFYIIRTFLIVSPLQGETNIKDIFESLCNLIKGAVF